MTKRHLFEQELNRIANTKRIEARPFQERIRDKVNRGWTDGMISQIIVSPTGSGKTVMGLVAARDFVTVIGPAKFGVKPEEIGVCWVAMRRNLLAQTEKANYELQLEEDARLEATRANEFVLCPNVEFVSMFEKDAAKRLTKYKVVFMVVDEAQHDAATTMVTLHTQIKPDIVLGLSATPMRSDNLKICFQREIRDAGYHFLIQDGYLSQFNHWMMREWTPASAARLYLRAPEKWGKSLVFFLNKQQCREFAGYLDNPNLLGINKLPVKCEIVHGGSNKMAQLDAFEAGRVQVLASMLVLTEGFDCPSLQSVFVRDTRSKGPAIQMSGRVLRLWKGVVKNIVQSQGTNYPFTRFAKAHGQFVEQDTGTWASIGINDRVNQMIAETTKQMVNSKPPELPAYFTIKRPVQRPAHPAHWREQE